MNARSFKVIFSKRLGALVAVGENATSQGKSASGETNHGGASALDALSSAAQYTGMLKTLCLAALIGALPKAFALDATALPTGADVRHGSATVGTEGATMTINQSTSRATINWQSFNVGTDARVNVVQNDSQSVLLNRVVGNEMSQIRGQISANGQVVLVNPNGIVMGPTGRITASAFTASTFGITDANFEAGHMKYERNGSTGQIVHQGHIQTAEAGGYVALIGADVNNQGTITTRQGAVVLAAADTVTLPNVSAINNVSVPLSRNVRLEINPAAFGSASVSNSGVIVTEGGQVLMRAASVVDAVSKVASATVIQSGSIDTTGAQGGGVDILADNGRIRVSGSVKANSTNGIAGGDVYIGRDESTNILAAVGDVRGAKLESKGGFVETSGQYLATNGVSVKAKEWLLDPTDITIVATGTATPDTATVSGSFLFQDTTAIGASEVLKSTIENAINAGTSVTISTANGPGTGSGNITIATALSFNNTGPQDATFKLFAMNGITQNVGSTITAVGSKNVNIEMESWGRHMGVDANSTGSRGIVINSAISTNGAVKIDGFNRNTGANIAGVTFNSGASISAASFDIRGRSNTIGIHSHGVLINGGSATGTNFTATSNTVASVINGISLSNSNGVNGGTNLNGTNINFNGGIAGLTVKGSNASTQLGVRISGSGDSTTVITNGKVTFGEFEPNSNFSMRAGSITANSGSLNIFGSAVNNFGGESITANNGVSINIEGKTTAGSTSNAVAFANMTIKAVNATPGGTAGNISITGTSSTGNAINFTPSVNIEGRNISLKGTATNGASASGAAINGSGKITASGTLKIEGVSANTGGYSTLTNGPLQAAGDITIEGTGTAKHGVNLGNNVAGNTITSTGGKIEVLGTTTGAGGIGGSASGSAVNGNAVITAEKDVIITGKTHGYYAINGLGNITSKTGNVTIDGYSRDSRGVNYDKTITATNGLIKVIGGSGVDGAVTSTAAGAGSEHGVYFSGLAKANNVTFQGTSINNVGTFVGSSSGTNIDATDKVTITGLSTASTGVNLGSPNGNAAFNATIKSGGDTSVTGTGVTGVRVWAGSNIDAKNIDVVGTSVTRTAGESGIGVDFERIVATANFKSSEDIRIEGNLTGAGVGSGVKTSWRNQNGNAPTMNAGGNFTLRANNRALASNTNAAINADSGMQVIAGKDIVVQAETNNMAARAMTFFSTGDNYRGNTSFVSTGGDVLVQANQGAIVFNNLQNNTAAGQSTDIKGRNITFDNTGAGMATGVGTLVGSGGTKGGTIGSGSIDTATGVMVLGAGQANAEAINFAQGRVINATGQLNIMGASKTSLGAQIFTELTGGSVNIQGTSETGGGIYNTRKIESTTGSISMIGRSTAATGHQGMTIQGEVKGKTDINLEGYSANTNDRQGIIVGDKVTAETGTIKVTGETKAANQRAVAITQLGAKFGSLNTTNKDITVIGNTLLIATGTPGATVNAGTGTVQIRTLDNANAIVIGGNDNMSATPSAQVLGIDNTELNRITAGKLVIGHAANTGGITVSAATTTVGQTGHVTLQTGGNIAVNQALTIATGKTLTLNGAGASSTISQANTSAGITADKAEFLGNNATVTLQPTATTSPSANKIGVIAGNVKSFVLTNQRDLTVGTVNSTVGLTAADNIVLTTTAATGTALSIEKKIESTAGNVEINATTFDTTVPTGAPFAAVKSSAEVKGKDITMNAVAMGATGKTLGYYGATGPTPRSGFFTAANNLSLKGSTQNEGNGFYMWRGALSAGNTLSIEGTSKLGQGVGFDGPSTTATNVSIESGNGVTIKGNALTAGQVGINLNGVDLKNNVVGAIRNASAVTLEALNGDITTFGTGTLTQSGNGGVKLTTVSDGNIFVPKIINNGTGNVVIAAGSDLLAGNGGGGQVKTVEGNTIAQGNATPGKTYIYSGNAAGTGLLSRLDSSFSELRLSGDMGTTSSPLAQNADSNVKYAVGTTIAGGANAQVMFREKIALVTGDIKGAPLNKTYGDSNTKDTDQTALFGEMQAQLKQANPGQIITRSLDGTNGAGEFKISKATLINDFSGSLSAPAFSTSLRLTAKTHEYGALTSTKYDATLEAGKAKVVVAKKEITLSGATASDKVYDQTDTATLTNVGGLTDGAANKDDKKKFADDVVTVTVTNAKFSDALVGDNKPVTVVAELTGGDAGNYTFITPANLTARITGAVEPVDPPGPVVPVPVPTPNNNTVVVAGGNNSFQLAGAEAACSADTLNQCECETATNPEGVALEGIQICYEPNTRPSSAL